MRGGEDVTPHSNVITLTTAWAGHCQDTTAGLLAAQHGRRGHHEPRHLTLLGAHLARLGGQEQVVLLPLLQTHLVDAGLKVLLGFLDGANLLLLLGSGLEEQQLDQRSNGLLSLFWFSFEDLKNLQKYHVNPAGLGTKYRPGE